MSEQDYEFRITVLPNKVRCDYETPKETGPKESKTILREEHLETIQVLEDWLRAWEWIARADNSSSLLVHDTFKVLGDHLWKMAFSEYPGEDLVDAIAYVQNSTSEPRPRVRVLISFKNAPDLEGLPWEFVHVPGQRSVFLAKATDLTLARYVTGPSRDQTIIEAPDDKLRVLFVASLPELEQKGNEDEEYAAARELYDEERRAIKDLCDKLNAVLPERIDAQYHQGWDYSEVADKLAAFRRDGGQVDVVHLAALFKRAGRALQLYLPNEQGVWKWKPSESVVNALTRPDTRPKLVVLHLCDWHKADLDNAPEHFERLAPEFIANQVPAVLAMQYPMRPYEVTDFVEHLYKLLAAGEHIGAAVQATRVKLASRDGRYFGSPVLYMQCMADGGLVKRVVSERDPETSANTERPISPMVTVAAPSHKLGLELVNVVERMSESDAAKELIEWIRREDWPTVASAETKIDVKRRDLNDDREAFDILNQMLIRVLQLGREDGAS
jgi:hypothetical protein